MEARFRFHGNGEHGKIKVKRKGVSALQRKRPLCFCPLTLILSPVGRGGLRSHPRPLRGRGQGVLYALAVFSGSGSGSGGGGGASGSHHSPLEKYSLICRAAFRPAPMARMTVAEPVTMSPAA